MEDNKVPLSKQDQAYYDRVEGLANRHLKAEKDKDKTVLLGLGMFGLVGWAVAVPTLLGIALGIWIDQHWPSSYSWTLMLLFLGLFTGCLNAWFWIRQSSRDE